MAGNSRILYCTKCRRTTYLQFIFHLWHIFCALHKSCQCCVKRGGGGGVCVCLGTQNWRSPQIMPWYCVNLHIHYPDYIVRAMITNAHTHTWWHARGGALVSASSILFCKSSPARARGLCIEIPDRNTDRLWVRSCAKTGMRRVGGGAIFVLWLINIINSTVWVCICSTCRLRPVYLPLSMSRPDIDHKFPALNFRCRIASQPASPCHYYY